jgi:epidermal growth factor receptor substrate 15
VPASSTSEWVIEDLERKKTVALFQSMLGPLERANGERIDADKAYVVLTKSRLPNDTLAKIWELADIDVSGALSEHEFVVAMHLVAKAIRGVPPPDDLPETLYPPTDGRSGGGQGGGDGGGHGGGDGGGAGPALTETEEPLVIPADLRVTSKKVFATVDADGDGKISGPEALKIFIKSKLDRYVHHSFEIRCPLSPANSIHFSFSVYFACAWRLALGAWRLALLLMMVVVVVIVTPLEAPCSALTGNRDTPLATL